MKQLSSLQSCRSGAAATEFAMVLPLLLLLLLGVIDAGRFLWDYNRAEKAVQVGVRTAVVTDMVPGGLSTYSFATAPTPKVPAGTVVDTSQFAEAVCNNSACTCTGGSVCSGLTYDTAAFTLIAGRMRQIAPAVEPADVTISYKNVGIGFAGNPSGPDVAPMVTVAVSNVGFQPMTTRIFGATFSLPTIRSSLTAEDAAGTVSN